MNEVLQRTCERFLENRSKIEQALRTREHRVTALYAVRFLDQLVLDEELLRDSKRILKSETGVFSGFRGYAQNACILALSASREPQTAMETAKEAYDVMKKSFGRSSQTALAAMQLQDQIPAWQMEETIRDAKTVYQQIKRENPMRFFKSDSASFLYTLVGLESKDVAIERIRAQYAALGASFSKGEGGRGAALVLSLSDEPVEQSTKRLRSLYDLLKQNGLHYGRYSEMAALALLMRSGESPETLAASVQEVFQWLQEHRYKGWDMTKKTRLMHAALITAAAYGVPELDLELCLQIVINQIVKDKEASTAAAAS